MGHNILARFYVILGPVLGQAMMLLALRIIRKTHRCFIETSLTSQSENKEAGRCLLFLRWYAAQFKYFR